MLPAKGSTPLSVVAERGFEVTATPPPPIDHVTPQCLVIRHRVRRGGAGLPPVRRTPGCPR